MDVRSILISIAIAALFLISVSVVLCPIASSETGKLSISERVAQLVQAGQTGQAVALLNSILVKNPLNLKARLLLAEVYTKSGDANKAEQEFGNALRLHPESAAAALALCEFYIVRSEFASAQHVLTDAVQRHPQVGELHNQLAVVLAAEHKYKDAAAQIRLVTPPRNPVARVRYFRLAASIHSGLGERVAAARAVEAAVSATPNDYQLRLITALAEADAEEWRSCIRNIAPVFAKHPSQEVGLILLRAQLADHADYTSTLATLRQLDLPDDRRSELLVHLGELFASADKHREAAEEFAAALKMRNGADSTLTYNLAVEEYADGEYQQALAIAQSLRQKTQSAEVEDLAADIEEQSANASAAIRDHQNAIALAPDEERYRLSLGAALLRYGDYKGAADVFQQSVGLFPSSVRSYVGLGLADYLVEKYDDSVAAFLHAAELDGGSGRVLGYLGATQMDSAAGPSSAAVNFICNRAESGSEDSVAMAWCGALLFRKAYLSGNRSAMVEVIPRLRTALKLAPSDPVANCSLGRALAWIQRSAAARSFLENCVRLRPDSTEDHYHLGEVYRSLGLRHKAEEQAAVITKINAARDEKAAMAQKFTSEMTTVRQAAGK